MTIEEERWIGIRNCIIYEIKTLVESKQCYDMETLYKYDSLIGSLVKMSELEKDEGKEDSWNKLRWYIVGLLQAERKENYSFGSNNSCYVPRHSIARLYTSVKLLISMSDLEKK